MSEEQIELLPGHRPASRVLAAIMGEHWAITETGYEKLLEIASRENVITPEVRDKIERQQVAVLAKKAAKMDGASRATKRDGVAIIDVTGPIFRYANLFSSISGATSVEELATDITAALNDPNVKGVVLTFDSPGGQVSGVNELAQMLASRESDKPCVAYIGTMAASAAYWLAAATDEIVIDATGEAGSIGAVVSARIPPPASSIEKISSNAPKKRLNPTSEAGQAELQATADQIGETFEAFVRANRPDGVDTLQGGMAMGQKAVKAGLADRVGSLEQTIAAVAKRADEEMQASQMRAASVERLNAALRDFNAFAETGRVAAERLASALAATDPDSDADTDECACCANGDCPDCSTQDEKDGTCSCHADCPGCKEAGCGGMNDTDQDARAAVVADRKANNREKNIMSEITVEQFNKATAALEEANKKIAALQKQAKAQEARAAATAFMAQFTASNPLAFGKTEAEKFSALFEATKVAALSENAELAAFAITQLAALEAYATAKAPIAPKGIMKLTPVSPVAAEDALTAEDFRSSDPDVIAKIDRAADAYVAEKKLTGPHAYLHAIEALAKQSGVRPVAVAPGYGGPDADDDEE